jgi:hypothetical protein
MTSQVEDLYAQSTHEISMFMLEFWEHFICIVSDYSQTQGENFVDKYTYAFWFKIYEYYT